jgi:hypothetical protein
LFDHWIAATGCVEIDDNFNGIIRKISSRSGLDHIAVVSLSPDFDQWPIIDMAYSSWCSDRRLIVPHPTMAVFTS